ncbi:olfactory receptor 52Z1P-like [Dunckerocampus dactyliophorus]|uniref:olfactory receptor 52Z1P-like n=1 Tax=Dunckerocampus dactyliophorus TaxID=161453 RepID=UPI0024056297|nr:olfactory receptor 52Z1P-like [Dunckerocampus dactyliophorus]
MDTNASSQWLLLQSLDLSSKQVYPSFAFGTLTYLIVVFCNLLVSVTIATSKKLHKPMFILLFNLPLSDLLGATAFFPHFLFSILSHNRLISPHACMAQAFIIHVYGTANLLTLTAMAYDRYIAVCSPLRYHVIMSPEKLIKIIFSIWFIDFSIMGVLFALLVRLRFCRSRIVDLYCNNPSLLKLTCEDNTVNNIYGLVGIVFLQGGTLSIVVYTYAQILRVCIMTNNLDTRRKAIQTCSTHLTVFVILQINTVFTLLAHRIEGVPPYLRRLLGLSILVFPPFLDPVIYGLKVTELKESIGFIVRKTCRLSKLCRK